MECRQPAAVETETKLSPRWGRMSATPSGPVPKQGIGSETLREIIRSLSAFQWKRCAAPCAAERPGGFTDRQPAARKRERRPREGGPGKLVAHAFADEAYGSSRPATRICRPAAAGADKPIVKNAPRAFPDELVFHKNQRFLNILNAGEIHRLFYGRNGRFPF
jgi:hypothetical protein